MSEHWVLHLWYEGRAGNVSCWPLAEEAARVALDELAARTHSRITVRACDDSSRWVIDTRCVEQAQIQPVAAVRA